MAKQVIWILTSDLGHGIEVARQHELRNAQVEVITPHTLYRLRGTINPVVIVPSCHKVQDIVLSRLDVMAANLIYTGCRHAEDQ